MTLNCLSRSKSRTRSSSKLLSKKQGALMRSASRRFGSVPHLFNYMPPPKSQIDPVALLARSASVRHSQRAIKERRRTSFYESILPSSSTTKKERRTSFYEGIYSEKELFLTDLGNDIPRPLTPRRVHTEPVKFQPRSGQFSEAPYRGPRHSHVPVMAQQQLQRPKSKRYYGNLGQPEAADTNYNLQQPAPPTAVRPQPPVVPGRSRIRCYSTPMNPMGAHTQNGEFGGAVAAAGLRDRSRANSVYVQSPLRASSTSLADSEHSAPQSPISRRRPVRRRPISTTTHMTSSLPHSESEQDSLYSVKSSRKPYPVEPVEKIYNPYVNVQAVTREETSSAAASFEPEEKRESVLITEIASPVPISSTWVTADEVPFTPMITQGEPEAAVTESFDNLPFSSLSLEDLMEEFHGGALKQVDVPEELTASQKQLDTQFPLSTLHQDENVSTSSFRTALSSPVMFDATSGNHSPESISDALFHQAAAQRNSVISMMSDGSTVKSDTKYPVQLSMSSSGEDDEYDTSSDYTLPGSGGSNTLEKTNSIPVAIVGHGDTALQIHAAVGGLDRSDTVKSKAGEHDPSVGYADLISSYF